MQHLKIVSSVARHLRLRWRAMFWTRHLSCMGDGPHRCRMSPMTDRWRVMQLHLHFQKPVQKANSEWCTLQLHLHFQKDYCTLQLHLHFQKKNQSYYSCTYNSRKKVQSYYSCTYTSRKKIQSYYSCTYIAIALILPERKFGLLYIAVALTLPESKFSHITSKFRQQVMYIAV